MHHETLRLISTANRGPCTRLLASTRAPLHNLQPPPPDPIRAPHVRKHRNHAHAPCALDHLVDLALRAPRQARLLALLDPAQGVHERQDKVGVEGVVDRVRARDVEWVLGFGDGLARAQQGGAHAWGALGV